VEIKMTRKPSPSRLVVNVDNCKLSAKGLTAYFNIRQTVTGVCITIEPPLANFILDPIFQENSHDEQK
jgi:hypothetical protein